MQPEQQALIEEVYGKNELQELFEIKLSREDFRKLSLLKGMNILDSESLLLIKVSGVK